MHVQNGEGQKARGGQVDLEEAPGEQDDEDVDRVRPERAEGVPDGVPAAQAGAAQEGGGEDGPTARGGDQERKVSAHNDVQCFFINQFKGRFAKVHL